MKCLFCGLKLSDPTSHEVGLLFVCGVVIKLPHCVDVLMISTIIIRPYQWFLNVGFELTYDLEKAQ